MMRWILLFLLLTLQLNGEQFKLSVGAEGAILMNAKTGAVLFEKNAHTQAYPASTTKMATALYTLHQCHKNTDPEQLRKVLTQRFTADRETVASISPQAKKQSNYRSPAYWLETDGSHIGIKYGEELRLYDLLNAMLIASANDASNLIAQGIGGTIPKFMEGVNQYLKELGCKNTYFNNPHGLHHPDHVTTPYDLALMAQEGLKDPIFRRIVRTSMYTCPQTNLEYERNLGQTNLLLRQGAHGYSKAIGIKTGTTQAAGKNLVAAAEENGRTLIAVALGCRGSRSELYQDVIKMFETAFKEPKMRRLLLPQGPQKLTTKVRGARKLLKTTLPEGLYYDFYPSEDVRIKAKVVWNSLTLPVREGECVGYVQVVDEHDTLLQQSPLFAFADLSPNIVYRIHSLFAEYKRIIFGSGAGILIIFLWRARRKKRSRRALYK